MRGVFFAGSVWGLILLCGLTGCSNFDMKENIPWKDTSDTPKIPGRITALWSHTVLEQPGKRGVRGFGGRVMFHERETEKAVMVEGDLIVYAFDSTDGPKSQPDKKFVFTSEQLSQHHSKSRLGHSYSLWLPWDEVGGTPRRISLLVRFSPEGAATLMSETAEVMLPGIDAEMKQEIQQAANKFKERQKQLAAEKGAQASLQTNNSTGEGGVVPLNQAAEAGEILPTGVTQEGVKETLSQKPGMDVITLEASPGIGEMLQRAPKIEALPEAREAPQQKEAAPQKTSEKSTTGMPVKASLSEQAAARRPSRFAPPRHRAQALGNSQATRGRGSLLLSPSAQRSGQTGSPESGQSGLPDQSGGSVPGVTTN